MKTKLLILVGITMSIVSAIAVAGNLFTSPWITELSQVQQALPGNILPADTLLSTEKIEPPLIITKDSNALIGQGYFYAENGSLYKEEINADGVLATTTKNVATGSIRLVDQSDDAVLFIKDISVPQEGLSGYKNELWLLDKRVGTIKKLLDNVTQDGSISSVAQLIVVRNTGNQLIVLTYDGISTTSTNVYGASPVFSPTGDKIAYIKLKDGHIEMGTPDMLQGIAVYDLVAGKDTLILSSAPGENEWMIAGWSADGKRIYFPSADSTWSVGIDGTEKRQETNKIAGVSRVPAYLSHLLFTSDGALAFGEAEGLWAFSLSNTGEFLSAKKVVEGTQGFSSQLHWLEKDRSVSSHLYGKVSTTVYRISDLNR